MWIQVHMIRKKEVPGLSVRFPIEDSSIYALEYKPGRRSGEWIMPVTVNTDDISRAYPRTIDRPGTRLVFKDGSAMPIAEDYATWQRLANGSARGSGLFGPPHPLGDVAHRTHSASPPQLTTTALPQPATTYLLLQTANAETVGASVYLVPNAAWAAFDKVCQEHGLSLSHSDAPLVGTLAIAGDDRYSVRLIVREPEAPVEAPANAPTEASAGVTHAAPEAAFAGSGAASGDAGLAALSGEDDGGYAG